MAFPLQSPELAAWATGFPMLLLHVGMTLVILGLGAALYAFVTPQREIALVREGNPAAAVSFGAVLVSLALPLALTMAASTSLLELLLWGAATTIVQLFLFWLTDLIFAGLPQRIRDGDVAAAVLIAAARLATAAILAGAVTR